MRAINLSKKNVQPLRFQRVEVLWSVDAGRRAIAGPDIEEDAGERPFRHPTLSGSSTGLNCFA